MHKLYTQKTNDALNALMESPNVTPLVDFIIDDSKDESSALITNTLPAIEFFYKGNKGVKWSIDGSALKPSAAVQMSGKNFNAAYLAQLNKTLYHTSEEPDMTSLLEVMFVQEIAKSSRAVKITSAKYVHKLPAIASVLTSFFKTNHHVLNAISTMVGNQLAEDTK